MMIGWIDLCSQFITLLMAPKWQISLIVMAIPVGMDSIQNKNVLPDFLVSSMQI